MSGSRRPGVLDVGDRVRVHGVIRTVVGVSGVLVRLADTSGHVVEIALSQLLTAPDFALVNAPQRPPVPPTGALEGLPAATVEEALLWWEGHVLEVLHGLPPDAEPGTRPRPEYDPERCSLARREQAKAAELPTGHWSDWTPQRWHGPAGGNGTWWRC